MNDDIQDSRILIVDDHPINVEILEDLLENEGYTQIDGLSDPREVASYCDRHLPDLILLDIRMPHISGQSLLETLRTQWGDHCPPIIVLTAQTDVDTRQEALAAGARDFITKPFDHFEALQRISNTLESHHRYKRRLEQNTELERIVAERTAEIRRQAMREPVTGLPNRRATLAELDRCLNNDEPVSAGFVAIDEIDHIARLHGYPVTEQLLGLMGQLITERLPKDFVGCWGTTEFVCCRREQQGEPTLTQDLEALRRSLSRTFQVGDLRLNIKLRIGVCYSDQKETNRNAEHIIRRAALALPERPESPVRQFDDCIEATLHHRDRIHRALRTAVTNDELHLLYQPKIDLISGRIIGAETLLRWTHPELGFISPGEFIPLAESSGEIISVGRWVMEQTIAQAAEWARDGLVDGPFSLAMNMATRQLGLPDLAREVKDLIKQHRLESQYLEIEVTESGLMEDLEQARTHLTALADHGVSIAIDDFGTGYSSLAYLKNLPVHTLKIDRTFVDGIADDEQDRSLSKTVIDMAHNLGCRVVGEGVETPEQARLLTDLGVEMAQGYWFARPMSAEDFVQFSRQPPQWTY